MIVTLDRAVWRQLCLMSATSTRETGSLLIGRRTKRGNIFVAASIPLTHKRATDSNLYYDPDEVASARKAAWDEFGPKLEPVGGFHVHPWEACHHLALLNQISDDWDDPNSDVSDMLDNEIEFIISAFPDPHYKIEKLKGNDFILQATVSGKICRGEAWFRAKKGKIVPCEVRVR